MLTQIDVRPAFAELAYQAAKQNIVVDSNLVMNSLSEHRPDLFPNDQELDQRTREYLEAALQKMGLKNNEGMWGTDYDHPKIPRRVLTSPDQLPFFHNNQQLIGIVMDICNPTQANYENSIMVDDSFCFEGKDILEIGPGTNTHEVDLSLLGAKSYTVAEPFYHAKKQWQIENAQSRLFYRRSEGKTDDPKLIETSFFAEDALSFFNNHPEKMFDTIMAFSVWKHTVMFGGIPRDSTLAEVEYLGGAAMEYLCRVVTAIKKSLKPGGHYFGSNITDRFEIQGFQIDKYGFTPTKETFNPGIRFSY